VSSGHGKKGDTIKEGDVVLIGRDNAKRMDWDLARVLKIFPGVDGVPRVARLRTTTGELTRPYQRLYPMELSSENRDNLGQIEGVAKKSGKIVTKDVVKDVVTKSGRKVVPPKRF